jgi:ribonuclease P protein component
VRKRWEFQLVQAEARRFSTPRFVFLQRARDPTGARLGVTASRKLGSAVVRNRAKRLIREAFRATRDLWPDDVDVVVVARQPLTDKKLPDVVAEWRGAAPELKRRQNQARRDFEARKSQLAPRA